MDPQIENAIEQAVRQVCERVRSANGRYFDSYHVFDELRKVNKGKEYVQLLCKYATDEHPFRQIHAVIGTHLERYQKKLGIKKVIDSDGDPVRMYIEENIVYGKDAVQVWKIVDVND